MRRKRWLKNFIEGMGEFGLWYFFMRFELYCGLLGAFIAWHVGHDFAGVYLAIPMALVGFIIGVVLAIAANIFILLND